MHAMPLWESGFLRGYDAGGLSERRLIAPALTRKGHDLLDTLRGEPVWVGSMSDLIAALEAVKEAVPAGELDALFEQASGAMRAGFG